jgi:type I restriction enzyme M protein
MGNGNGKSLETWIWDAACSIRGAKDAAKFKDFILPLIFTKRLCDVFDDELNRIAEEVGSRAKAFKLVKHDKKLVRFYLPLEPKNPDDAVWSVIRTLSDKIGEQLTTHLRGIGDANPLLKGIIDRVDFNATTHGQRDIDDNRLSNLIEEISAKRLGLKDVEAGTILTKASLRTGGPAWLLVATCRQLAPFETSRYRGVFGRPSYLTRWRT